ncbi:MAG TPA: transglutaminase domain-containing protein, partial [Allocoleopsis sp.]
RSPVPLSEGLTYTVVSEVPYRNRTLLQKAGTTLPPFIKDHYLQIPETIQPAVQQQTESILVRSPKPLTTASEKALYLAQYLKQNYSIQPDLPPLTETDDLVTAFLSKQKMVYPDHFSTALTMMLRSIGIPARLAVGFAPGEFNPFTGFYVVKNTDAYALTEVYFPKYGWFAFDPIPGHPLIPPSIEESKLFGVIQQFWNWIAGWLPSPVAGIFNRMFEWIGSAIGWFTGLFSQGWFGILVGIGVAIGCAFLGWLVWNGWQVWRYRRWLSNLPPMEALYQQMLRWLADQGVKKAPFQTPLEYAQFCREQQPPHRAKAIAEISEAYVSWRYGNQTPDLEYLWLRLRELKNLKTRG